MIPTAEDYALSTMQNVDTDDIVNVMIEFAKMHVTAALKAASREAVMDNRGYFLNAYPLENIK